MLSKKNADYELIGNILDFALHQLSPLHIGASLVWYPATDLPQKLRHASGGQWPPAALSFARAPTSWPSQTLLAQMDGASLVASDGEVAMVGMRLEPSDDALATIEGESGLRHTSAKYYSYDEPEAVVLVTSEDGPVTVYSDGTSLLTLRSIVCPPRRWETLFQRRPRTSAPRCRKSNVANAAAGCVWKLPTCPVGQTTRPCPARFVAKVASPALAALRLGLDL